MRRGAAAIVIWLLALAACAAIVAKSRFTADLSAFLPRAPTAQQQLLVEQIKDGALSRLLLIGIEGGDAAGRALLSRQLAARLHASADFTSVDNGDAATLARDRELLFKYRYLLSPAVNARRFSVDGLHRAIGDSIDLLASPAGLLVKGLLARDPTGETMELIDALDPGNGPATADGVWMSRDGRRALLMAQTTASGSDTDGQERALATLQAAFDDARRAAGSASARLLVSGTPVFSVDARAAIRSEVERLALLGAAGVVVLLLLVYRSVAALALGLVPVLSGALAGIAAVSLGFGAVHGLTVGFGTTLIGEAVDYSIYYFVQARGAERDWLADFWPTIRLGVLTSVCGFASLLLSGFPGLAQLGLYSITGLVTAAAVTRFVLPRLRPAGFRVRDVDALGARALRWTAALGRLRWGALPLVAIAAGVVAVNRDHLWNASLADLSPLSPADVALDQSLRADLSAPDQRYLVVVDAPEREAALAGAERAAAVLRSLVEGGVVAGFETPTRFLPSVAAQRARQAALPTRAELLARLPPALADLPLRPAKLAPFVADVEAAKQLPLLTPDALAGSRLGLAVDAMLLKRPDGWSALLPLRAPASGDIDAAAVRAALAGVPGALCVDLAGESNRLYAGYLSEAIHLSLAGLAAIVVLLAAALRAPARVLRVLAPLAAAVLLVMAGLALTGERLTLLHLVGLLLIVAVGSNYALFFDRRSLAAPTLASLLVANAATVIGFGVLATSQLPILHAIGITVGPGAVLALLLSALLARTESR